MGVISHGIRSCCRWIDIMRMRNVLPRLFGANRIARCPITAIGAAGCVGIVGRAIGPTANKLAAIVGKVKGRGAVACAIGCTNNSKQRGIGCARNGRPVTFQIACRNNTRGPYFDLTDFPRTGSGKGDPICAVISFKIVGRCVEPDHTRRGRCRTIGRCILWQDHGGFRRSRSCGEFKNRSGRNRACSDFNGSVCIYAQTLGSQSCNTDNAGCRRKQTGVHFAGTIGAGRRGGSSKICGAYAQPCGRAPLIGFKTVARRVISHHACHAGRALRIRSLWQDDRVRSCRGVNCGPARHRRRAQRNASRAQIAIDCISDIQPVIRSDCRRRHRATGADQNVARTCRQARMSHPIANHCIIGTSRQGSTSVCSKSRVIRTCDGCIQGIISNGCIPAAHSGCLQRIVSKGSVVAAGGNSIPGT